MRIDRLFRLEKAERGCTRRPFHCWEKAPERKNLEEERLICLWFQRLQSSVRWSHISGHVVRENTMKETHTGGKLLMSQKPGNMKCGQEEGTGDEIHPAKGCSQRHTSTTQTPPPQNATAKFRSERPETGRREELGRMMQSATLAFGCDIITSVSLESHCLFFYLIYSTVDSDVCRH